MAKEAERLTLAHPLHPVLISTPGVTAGPQPRLLIDVVSRAFVCGHLAAYAGLASVTRRSSPSIRAEFPSRVEYRPLNVRCSFGLRRIPCSMSRACYTRKTSQGQRHNRALTALTRSPGDV